MVFLGFVPIQVWAEAKLRGGPITPEERQLWSLQPISNPIPPQVRDQSWPRNPIDQFILARLETEGLRPVSAATKRTLLRRVTFDLTGLPPTPHDLEKFLADESPEAWRAVVDRLLATQVYGERWGRHWLDVVRYADTAGETGDYPVPQAYRYRNWVINAFNDDMPYDRFIREQVAGDLLAERTDNLRPEEYENLVTATGFIAISRRFGFDSENYHHLTIQDTIDTLGQAVLGLTLGCARCHDHKYDPVNMDDYYGLYGIFQSTKYSFPGSEEKKRPYDMVPVVPRAQALKLAEHHAARLQSLEDEIKGWEEEKKQLEDNPRALAVERNDPLAKEKPSIPWETRFFYEGPVDRGASRAAPAMDPAWLARIDELTARIKDATAERDELNGRSPFATVYGAQEGAPADARRQLRGDPKLAGDLVSRRNLEILGGDPVGNPDQESGRRQLAKWLTRPDNPLTARVMVNRIWQHHFGHGLVRTENDFGARGERPSHPELLDWLAQRFIQDGWSIKALHRLILSSATYRLSSAEDATARERDGETRWRWRFDRRRLSAEEFRDALLFLSGELDSEMGGEHPFPAEATWGFTQHNPYYGIYETKKRSVYLMQQRLKRHPYLALFDGADSNTSTAKRMPTTTPTQALYLMNSPFVHDQSLALARRLVSHGGEDGELIRELFARILNRAPTGGEVAAAREFMAGYQRQWAEVSSEDREGQRQQVVAGFVRTLLVRNEFLFVD